MHKRITLSFKIKTFELGTTFTSNRSIINLKYFNIVGIIINHEYFFGKIFYFDSLFRGITIIRFTVGKFMIVRLGKWRNLVVVGSTVNGLFCVPQ